MEKIILRYNQKIQEALNTTITRVLVQKVSGLMYIVRISSEKLEERWLEDELFMRDLKRVVSHITPYVPFIGLLSGAASFGKDFVEKRCGQRPERTEASEANSRSERSEQPSRSDNDE